MKFRKILTGIMASALMACSLSTVSANAAATVNADVTKSIQIVDNLDRMISLRKTMPMKGDINGDKKITSEDTTVLEVYLNGYIKIDPNSLAYRVLDVNWDGKLDKSDLRLMPTKNSSTYPYIGTGLIGLSAFTLHSGDFNYDGVVNSTDLTRLSSMIKSIESASKYKLALHDPLGYTDIITMSRQYDLNGDGAVNSKDYDALKSYISFFPGSLLIGVL